MDADRKRLAEQLRAKAHVGDSVTNKVQRLQAELAAKEAELAAERRKAARCVYVRVCECVCAKLLELAMQQLCFSLSPTATADLFSNITQRQLP